MKRLEHYLYGCQPPSSLPAELIERYQHHAQWHGDEQIKKDASSAERTATQLEKSVQQFGQLTSKDQRSLLAAASAMRALARNLVTLASWANKFKTHCDKVRKDDLVAKITKLATERWANKREQEFELALVDELFTKEGMKIYSDWVRSNGKHLHIAAENFAFSAYNRRAAIDRNAGDLPAHLQHLIAIDESHDFQHGGPSEGGYFYIARPQFEEYLKFRKTLAQHVNRILRTPQTNIDSGSFECPMCGGTGGWPGPQGHVTCHPCSGTGRGTGNDPTR